MFYDIYLYTLCYCICCLLGACMRCTRLCSLKPGVTAAAAARRALEQRVAAFTAEERREAARQEAARLEAARIEAERRQAARLEQE
jgi:hypothetical protein